MSTDILLELPPQAFIIFKENPSIEHLSLIRCGAYTSEWVAKALGIDGPKTNDILQAPSWHDYFHPVFPLTILHLLKERHLESTSYKVDAYMTAEQKINWIQREIVTHKKPLLLLIKAATLHWVVITGYDDERKVFYVYDPSFSTTSLSADIAIGNMEVDYMRLLHEWSGSWIFKYIAILILNDPLETHELPDLEIQGEEVAETPVEEVAAEVAPVDTYKENFLLWLFFGECCVTFW
jgi:hypothetical protein